MAKSSIARLTIVLAGARVFCLGMLALLLTLPCDSGAGAVNFAYSGFKKDSLRVRQKCWKLNTTTGCFKFHPPVENTVGQLQSLYHDAVPVTDPGSKTVKSFSTTFIYKFHKDSKVPYTGPGMGFTMVADDTRGTPQLEFMGFHGTAETPPSLKYQDYQQIWIDYSEVNSRMHIYYANYNQGKPAQSAEESETGLDLSFLKKKMYIGFSTAEGIDRRNVPYVCAWSFTNDGSQLPSIVIAEDASPAAPPPPPGPPPPSPPLSPDGSATPPSRSPIPPPNPAISPSPGPGHEPPPVNVLWGYLAVLVVIICLFSLCWCTVCTRPLRVFISHAGGLDGAGKNFPSWLHQAMTSHRRWSRSKFHVKPFIDVENCPKGLPFAGKIVKELERFDVGVVVVTRDFFERRWPMTELMKFVEVQRNDREGRIRVLPLFYELQPDELKQALDEGTWENFWEVNHPLQLQECKDAVTWLCGQTGIRYPSHHRDQDRAYIDTILKEVDKILRDERSIAADLCWAMKKLNITRSSPTATETE